MAKNKKDPKKGKSDDSSGFNLDKSSNESGSSFSLSKNNPSEASSFALSKNDSADEKSSFNISKNTDNSVNDGNQSKAAEDQSSSAATGSVKLEKSEGQNATAAKQKVDISKAGTEAKIDTAKLKAEESKEDKSNSAGKKEPSDSIKQADKAKELVQNEAESHSTNTVAKESAKSNRKVLLVAAVLVLVALVYFLLPENKSVNGAAESMAESTIEQSSSENLSPKDNNSPLVDSDGDGQFDSAEISQGSDPNDNTSTYTDSDNDGLSDVFESTHNLDPNNYNDAAEDSDEDGLSNLSEMISGTSPVTSDSDKDGQSDGAELSQGSNPIDMSSTYADSDNDGLSDDFETINGLDPNNYNDPEGDFNGNGLSDLSEMLTSVNSTNIKSESLDLESGATDKSSENSISTNSENSGQGQLAESSSSNTTPNTGDSSESDSQASENTASAKDIAKSESTKVAETSNSAAQASSRSGSNKATFNSNDDILYFEFNSSEIQNASALEDLVQFVNSSNPSITLVGHTDSTGDEEVNMTISVLRAQAIYDYLQGRGVQVAKVKVTGKGEVSPKYSNETAAGRQKNRRVEIILN